MIYARVLASYWDQDVVLSAVMPLADRRDMACRWLAGCNSLGAGSRSSRVAVHDYLEQAQDS